MTAEPVLLCELRHVAVFRGEQFAPEFLALDPLKAGGHAGGRLFLPPAVKERRR